VEIECFSVFLAVAGNGLKIVSKKINLFTRPVYPFAKPKMATPTILFHSSQLKMWLEIL
jgi:hypothetical protein